jgi:hypothetical protein
MGKNPMHSLECQQTFLCRWGAEKTQQIEQKQKTVIVEYVRD